MKKLLLFIAVLIFGMPQLARAQQKWTLSTAAASCPASNTSCLVYGIDAASGGAVFTITANASGNTIQFEATGDGGTTWSALSVTPSNGTTPVTSTTATSGTWQGNVAGYTAVRMRMSTLAGGTATVSIITSLASARSGGGGGGGGVTSITGDGTVITNSASSGAVTLTIAGTSGGIPCFNSASTWQSSAAITVNDAITGGGAGACAKDSAVIVYRGARAVATNTVVGGTGLSGDAAGTDVQNTAFGTGALASETGSATATGSTAIGYNALTSQNNSNGVNTAIGAGALSGVTTGNDNVGIGNNACNNITTTNNNICIGQGAVVSATGDHDEIVIGRGGVGAGTGTALIGAALVTDVYFGSSTPVAWIRPTGVISMGTKPTITGTGACATTSTATGGASAGTITCTGTTGASTLTITFTKTAPTGYACDAWDETTGANLPHQTSHTTTTCVLTVTSVSANDVIVFKAIAF